MKEKRNITPYSRIRQVCTSAQESFYKGDLLTDRSVTSAVQCLKSLTNGLIIEPSAALWCFPCSLQGDSVWLIALTPLPVRFSSFFATDRVCHCRDFARSPTCTAGYGAIRRRQCGAHTVIHLLHSQSATWRQEKRAATSAWLSQQLSRKNILSTGEGQQTACNAEVSDDALFGLTLPSLARDCVRSHFLQLKRSTSLHPEGITIYGGTRSYYSSRSAHNALFVFPNVFGEQTMMTVTLVAPMRPDR